jgi:hypothetical protein
MVFHVHPLVPVRLVRFVAHAAIVPGAGIDAERLSVRCLGYANRSSKPKYPRDVNQLAEAKRPGLRSGPVKILKYSIKTQQNRPLPY